MPRSKISISQIAYPNHKANSKAPTVSSHSKVNSTKTPNVPPHQVMGHPNKNNRRTTMILITKPSSILPMKTFRMYYLVLPLLLTKTTIRTPQNKTIHHWHIRYLRQMLRLYYPRHSLQVNCLELKELQALNWRLLLVLLD